MRALRKRFGHFRNKDTSLRPKCRDPGVLDNGSRIFTYLQDDLSMYNLSCIISLYTINSVLNICRRLVFDQIVHPHRSLT